MRGSQIPIVLKTGKTLSSPLFNLKYLSQPKETEVGIIISSKIMPLAVDRNRLKRRLRHILLDSNLKPGQYLILSKPSIKTADFKKLKHEISNFKLN